MIPSNTICVSQEGPANALALNKDSTQVVIAGRNVFKVFSIGENEFSEVCNLRVGKNLNLNFSSIDVAWSTIEENTLATAATNGAVVVWNLGRSGRSKQEHVFSDHKRTVNKVSFHLTEPALLISGSQDGMMKCFDLRMKEVCRTFISNTESIRDVQFSPHQAHTFAAVSENGSVQVWDVRRHERCLLQYTAHSGPVFACDWHPDLPWLATASRDKTIKVWDMQSKPNLEHTIYTIASVGHVRWRPQRPHQVASCALVLDCAVHVWDVRRPHVPLATFAEHRDVTTAIAWLAEPHTFLSTSRDCSLYRHRFSEAAHPVLWANPQGVCVSARGEVAYAAPERPLPALPSAPPHPERHVPGLGRKQPTAGSLSAGAQAALERAFPGGAGSALSRYRVCGAAGEAGGAGRAGGADAVLQCARQYRMRGAAPHELAEHNAEVARAHNRHLVWHVWQVVRCVYGRARWRRSRRRRWRSGRRRSSTTAACWASPRSASTSRPRAPPSPRAQTSAAGGCRRRPRTTWTWRRRTGPCPRRPSRCASRRRRPARTPSTRTTRRTPSTHSTRAAARPRTPPRPTTRTWRWGGVARARRAAARAARAARVALAARAARLARPARLARAARPAPRRRTSITPPRTTRRRAGGWRCACRRRARSWRWRRCWRPRWRCTRSSATCRRRPSSASCCRTTGVISFPTSRRACRNTGYSAISNCSRDISFGTSPPKWCGARGSAACGCCRSSPPAWRCAAAAAGAARAPTPRATPAATCRRTRAARPTSAPCATRWCAGCTPGARAARTAATCSTCGAGWRATSSAPPAAATTASSADTHTQTHRQTHTDTQARAI